MDVFLKPAFHALSRLLLTFLVVIGMINLASGQEVYDKVVTGSFDDGGYFDIQSAIRSVPSGNEERVLIYVKNGVYKEKLVISSNKKVSLIGENVDSVIISYDDYNGKTSSIGTADSYTFLSNGNDFYMENITVENTSGDVGQAVAIMTDGDRQVYKNCKFTGFQDTYYAHSNRQYNVDCYVEGATDFIFGDATAVFENSTINCVKGGQYITAPADTKLTSTIESDSTFLHGLLFKNCDVTADADVSDDSYYLGRPWQPNASSVYVNCTLGGHIRPVGWSDWDNQNHLSAFFAEYNSVDASGNTLDVSNRVAWSKQLDESAVSNYYTLDYFLAKDGEPWDPTAMTQAPASPDGLSASGAELNWNEVSGAIGYLIKRNNITVGFSSTTSFNDTTSMTALENNYTVQAVGAHGNLSDGSEAITVTASILNVETPSTAFEVTIKDQQLITSEPLNIKVYSLDGKLVGQWNHTQRVLLSHFSSGVYVLKMTNRQGQTITKKIAV